MFGRSNHISQIDFNKSLYRTCEPIQIMFGRFRDWRRIAMRLDRAAHTFFSAIFAAAVVVFGPSAISPDPRR